MQTSGAKRRENAKLHPAVIACENAKRLRKGANATKQSMAQQAARWIASLPRNVGDTISPYYPCGVTEILAQSRRPVSTQSWVLRRSAMLTASQMPMAVSATVNASAAILASMR